MGNPDRNLAKELESLSVEPEYTWKRDGAKEVLMYEYSCLNEVTNSKSLAAGLLNDEMRQYLTAKGYEIVEWDSDDGRRFCADMESRINDELTKAGSKNGVTVQNGTPIMVERVDESNPRRAINVIFAIVKKRNTDGVYEYQMYAHPVEVDERKIACIGTQRRTDNQKFEPPIWPVQPDYPFGYRGRMSRNIVSYPTRGHSNS